MKISMMFAAGALAIAGIAATPAPAEARTYVSVGFGTGYYGGGHYGPRYGYYGPGYGYGRGYYGRSVRRHHYGRPGIFYDNGGYGRPRYYRGDRRWRGDRRRYDRW